MVEIVRRWQHQRRIRHAAGQMLAARRSGLGLYLSEWRPTAAPEDSREALPEGVIAWCRETIARCRRPYGIDHFDLTLACVAGTGPHKLAQFRELQPDDLYAAGRLAERLAEFFAGALGLDHDVWHVAAALYSWGDAADAALPVVI